MRPDETAAGAHPCVPPTSGAPAHPPGSDWPCPECGSRWTLRLLARRDGQPVQAVWDEHARTGVGRTFRWDSAAAGPGQVLYEPGCPPLDSCPDCGLALQTRCPAHGPVPASWAETERMRAALSSVEALVRSWDGTHVGAIRLLEGPVRSTLDRALR